MSIPQKEKHFRNKALIAPTLILVSCLVLTVLGWRLSERSANTREAEEFEQVTLNIEEAVQSRLRFIGTALRGLQGLYQASVKVERSEFRDYYNLIQPLEQYPGAVAMSFFRRVSKEERERFIAEMRADTLVIPGGFPDFDIYPMGGAR